MHSSAMEQLPSNWFAKIPVKIQIDDQGYCQSNYTSTERILGCYSSSYSFFLPERGSILKEQLGISKKNPSVQLCRGRLWVFLLAHCCGTIEWVNGSPTRREKMPTSYFLSDFTLRHGNGSYLAPFLFG